MKEWRCKNCEHINNPSDKFCEICGNLRAHFKYINYELTSEFGTINLSWDSVEADEVYILKKKKRIKVELSGVCIVTDCKHRETITFYAKNKISDNYEYLTILFEKPKIVFFEIESSKLLLGNKTKIDWEVYNAEEIKISEIGIVNSRGTATLALKKSLITIIAKNEIGYAEKSIGVDFNPLPNINFIAEKTKVEIGDSVKLSWNIVNAINVHLLYEGKKEEVPLEGAKVLTISKNTIFKVIVTALDNATLFEEQLSVEVFPKPVIRFFKVLPEVVISSQPVTLSWSIENAKKVVIDNGIGEVSMIGTKKTLLQKNKTMLKLTAYGELSNVEQEVFVKVFPTPIIESLKVPMPDFESRFKLDSMSLTPPDISVSINVPEFNFSFNLHKPEYITPDIPLNKIKPKYDSKSSIFNFSTLYEKIRRKTKA